GRPNVWYRTVDSLHRFILYHPTGDRPAVQYKRSGRGPRRDIVAGGLADDTNLALRVRDPYPVVAKRFPYAEVQLRFEVALAHFRVVDPDRKLEGDAVVAELEHVDDRCERALEDARLPGGELGHQPHRQLEVAVVADLHEDADLDVLAGVRMIEHGSRHQHFVWHDRLDPVQTSHDDVARGHDADGAGAVVDGDHVAQPDRSVQQDRESGDVVAGELLQSQADAYAESAAENRQHGHVDADDRQRHQHGDQQKQRPRYFRRYNAEIPVEMRTAHQPLLEQARSPKRQHDGDDDDDRVAPEIEDAELALADRHPRVFERGADFRQHADVVE